MPDKTKKIKENVRGRYYVDVSCINCTLCVEIAADNIRSNLEEGYEFFYKQPSSAEEEDCCLEAMDICPVNAIGNDGEDVGC
ncbi:MAG: ferredoxin [Thermodesulfobacteriota bacterium]